VVLESLGMFGLVYGFANAATHGWRATTTWGFIAAGVALLVAFGFWIGRAAHPLLPPRILLNRNRSGAYVAVLIASLALFATFLFLTYYLQRTLGFSPIKTGLAFLPVSAALAAAANFSTIVLMPRIGPRPVITTGLLVAAGAMAWFAQLGAHTSYARGVLGPLVVAGLGLGMVVAPAINTGTFGVAPQDAGVASATVTVGQQLGASIGTSLLNTIFATAMTSYISTHSSAASGSRTALINLASAHGYRTAFWWSCGIAAGGAVVSALLLHSGPLVSQATAPVSSQPTAQPTPDQAVSSIGPDRA